LLARSRACEVKVVLKITSIISSLHLSLAHSASSARRHIVSGRHFDFVRSLLLMMSLVLAGARFHRGVRRGVSKGVEDGCRPRTAVSGVARLLGVEGSGMAGLGNTSVRPRPPLAIRQWPFFIP
jgi:hypothetical protein